MGELPRDLERSVVPSNSASHRARTNETTARPSIPLISLRIGASQWLTDEAHERVLRFVGSQPGTIDELAFFTSDTHPPLPLVQIERRCERLAVVLPRTRRHGYGAGVNVLASMGHHDENLPNSLTEPWQRVTDPEGRVSQGSFCPGSAELLAYVDQVYTLLAKTGPDFIWIDDDVRLLGHAPVRATCFCDACVGGFSRETGASFTRESLSRALLGPATLERDDLRGHWLAHNRRIIAEFLTAIARATHRVNPAISLGFMTGDRFYEGYAFAEWAEALHGTSAGPPRWRPGGGFYADDTYMGLVDKAHDVGRQVSQLPDKISIIQSEIENFPYQRLRKSVEVTILEAGAHMAAGATGTALNILSMHQEALDEYAPFLDRVAEVRPFFLELQSTFGRKPAVGVWPAWNRDIFADRGIADGWFQASRNVESMRQPYVLGEIGLPIAYGPEGARVTAFSGAIPASFSRAELERIFRGGVILDIPALRALEQMGFGGVAGVTVAERIEQDAIEVLTEHAVNGRFSGWQRNCRQSFWPQAAFSLQALAAGVEPLARLVDYAGNDRGMTMTAYENAMGGRIVVMGYYPWTLIHDLAKSNQMKAICAWCSRETLPVVVETFARVVVWARQGAGEDPALLFLNASLDPIPELVLKVRTDSAEAEHLATNGHSAVLPTVACGTQHVLVSIKRVAPWSMHLLRF